jgi:hypothetical protein
MLRNFNINNTNEKLKIIGLLEDLIYKVSDLDDNEVAM